MFAIGTSGRYFRNVLSRRTLCPKRILPLMLGGHEVSSLYRRCRSPPVKSVQSFLLVGPPGPGKLGSRTRTHCDWPVHSVAQRRKAEMRLTWINNPVPRVWLLTSNKACQIHQLQLSPSLRLADHLKFSPARQAREIHLPSPITESAC